MDIRIQATSVIPAIVVIVFHVPMIVAMAKIVQLVAEDMDIRIQATCAIPPNAVIVMHVLLIVLMARTVQMVAEDGVNALPQVGQMFGFLAGLILVKKVMHQAL